MNKFILIISVLLLFSYNILGQCLSEIEYNAGGEEILFDRIVYSYSIGGFAATTLDNDNEIITQGYQQIDSILLNVVRIDTTAKIVAFPNPAKNKINLLFTGIEVPIYCKIEVFSSSGNSNWLGTDFFIEDEVPIEVNIKNQNIGVYWLRIYNKDGMKLIGIVKVIKIK